MLIIGMIFLGAVIVYSVDGAPVIPVMFACFVIGIFMQIDEKKKKDGKAKVRVRAKKDELERHLKKGKDGKLCHCPMKYRVFSAPHEMYRTPYCRNCGRVHGESNSFSQ